MIVTGLSYLVVPHEVAALKSIEQVVAEQQFFDAKRIQENAWLTDLVIADEEALHHRAIFLADMHDAAQRKMLELEHARMLEELHDKEMQRIFKHHASIGAFSNLYSNDKIQDESSTELRNINIEIAMLQRKIDLLNAQIAQKTNEIREEETVKMNVAIDEQLDDVVDELFAHNHQAVLEVVHTSECQKIHAAIFNLELKQAELRKELVASTVALNQIQTYRSILLLQLHNVATKIKKLDESFARTDDLSKLLQIETHLKNLQDEKRSLMTELKETSVHIIECKADIKRVESKIEDNKAAITNEYNALDRVYALMEEEKALVTEEAEFEAIQKAKSIAKKEVQTCNEKITVRVATETQKEQAQVIEFTKILLEKIDSKKALEVIIGMTGNNLKNNFLNKKS